MPICVEALNNGRLRDTQQSIEDCTNFVIYTLEEYEQLLQSAQNALISPEDIAYVWIWGFGSILIPWSIAYAIMWAKKTINLL